MSLRCSVDRISRNGQVKIKVATEDGVVIFLDEGVLAREKVRTQFAAAILVKAPEESKETIAQALLDLAVVPPEQKAGPQRLVEEAVPAPAPESPPEPIVGHELLDEIVAFLLRFLVLQKHQPEAIALWVAHSYVFMLMDTTPYLDVHSAAKRSGKSRLLEVLELLVSNPWSTAGVTPAALSRKVDRERPTLLLDEADATFKADKELAQAVRGILNSGYRITGKRTVCEGQGASIDYVDLSTYCPKALAGIGHLPDTITDRSIPIVLKRRARSEVVERFRLRKVRPEGVAFAARIAQWARQLDLENSTPDLPDELDYRAQEGWGILLAIADMAGGDWPERARAAAIALSAGKEVEDSSLGTKLLGDIKIAFGAHERMKSADLTKALVDMEDAPWGDVDDRGRALEPRRLAKMLKPYGIAPTTSRVGDKTPRGYEKAAFEDAWNRYLPPPDRLSETPKHLAENETTNRVETDKEGHDPIRNIEPQTTPMLRIENDGNEAPNRSDTGNVVDVSDRSGGTGEKTVDEGVI